MDLKLTHETRDGVTVITLAGELDVYTAREFRNYCEPLADEPGCLLVIDVGPCAFLDFTGLGTLVAILRRARSRSGEMTLAGPGESISKMLRTTGLTKVFGVCETADEAVRELLAGAS